MAQFEISNVVGTITYQQELDLPALAKTFKNRPEVSSVTYEPANNHWLQTRFAPDATYVPFYRNGKCSVVGTTSPEHFEEVVERVNALMRELLKFDYQPTTKIENIVATAELNSIPTLEVITIGLGLEQTEYEPEQFPGVIYRDGKSAIIIFSSGKIVCTGLVDLEQISSAIDEITKQIHTLTIK